MDIQSSVISSLIGTISIILIYIYLYGLYRERFMGIWAVSWLILFSRFIIFDTGLLPWKQYSLAIIAYQMLNITSVLMFVWGTHVFINKALNKWWLYGAAILSILSTVLTILASSLISKLMLSMIVCSFVGIWIGITFIRNIKLQGFGRLITGYAFILWSILSLLLPFVVAGSWFAPWSYSLGGALRLIIGLGTLVLSFEKTRIDLIRKETQYRLLTENAVDVIYHQQLLPEAKTKYISPSVFPITGYTSEEYYVDNNLIFNLIHPEDHSLLTDFIGNMPQSATFPLALRLVRKDGAISWIEQKVVPIYDDKDNLIAIEGIIRDITHRRNLEQIAFLFDRMNMVGSMAATVAHEIRNPMTTVRGYLQILGQKHEYQADKEKFNLMIEELDRANDIIREYLSLSQEKVANFKKCSINNIIEALFPLIQADAISSKVHAILELTSIPELLLDESEIRQLLLNLIRNSIEAMPEGGDLIIRTFIEGDKVTLSVSDQGPGIPAHILDKLGTPFITTKDQGTGLGLPLCYQIAHRHNARISVDTSNEGTTFFVHFSHPLT